MNDGSFVAKPNLASQMATNKKGYLDTLDGAEISEACALLDRLAYDGLRSAKWEFPRPGNLAPGRYSVHWSPPPSLVGGGWRCYVKTRV